MITEIIEHPNAWGWYGRKDRTGYEVRVRGQMWGMYCFLQTAWATANRLEEEWKNRGNDDAEGGDDR